MLAAAAGAAVVVAGIAFVGAEPPVRTKPTRPARLDL